MGTHGILGLPRSKSSRDTTVEQKKTGQGLNILDGICETMRGDYRDIYPVESCRTMVAARLSREQVGRAVGK